MEVAERGLSGEAYNIGTKTEIKNIEMVQLILNSLGKSHDLIDFVDDRLGHDFRYALNTEKIYLTTGWQSEIGLEDGMLETIKWYSNKTA